MTTATPAPQTQPDPGSVPRDRSHLGKPIFEVRELVKHFPVKGNAITGGGAVVQAVSGVSFTIKEGETLGIVGESGCGKTTMGRLLIRLIEATS